MACPDGEFPSSDDEVTFGPVIEFTKKCKIDEGSSGKPKGIGPEDNPVSDPSASEEEGSGESPKEPPIYEKLRKGAATIEEARRVHRCADLRVQRADDTIADDISEEARRVHRRADPRVRRADDTIANDISEEERRVHRRADPWVQRADDTIADDTIEEARRVHRRADPRVQRADDIIEEWRSEGRYRRTCTPKKPAPFDGKVSWQDYRVQFELISALNGWTRSQMALELATSLRDEALSVLALIEPTQRTDYFALATALEARFEPKAQAEAHRATLRNRLRRRGESLAALSQEIKKLTFKAYPTANSATLEQLTLHGFLDALSDPEMEWSIHQGKPATVQEAVGLAMEYESFRQARAKRKGRDEPREIYAAQVVSSPRPNYRNARPPPRGHPTTRPSSTNYSNTRPAGNGHQLV